MNSTPSQSISDTESQSRRWVPMWLIITLALAFYCGAIYFDSHGGWFSSNVYAPYRSAEEVASWNIGGPEDPLAAGRAVYAKTCVACHQPSGMGMPGQYPPLVDSEWVNETEPGRVIRLVLHGLTGPITVKGQKFNNTMVAWGPTLSDEEIAAVITFVRGNKEWGNNASPVTPAQVKAVREKTKTHAGPFTPDALLQISPAE